ncbi:MAG: prolyl oligopeptidase family serine peptidase [Planctomycetales bacterium]
MRVLVLGLVCFVTAVWGGDACAVEIQLRRTAGNVPFGLIGEVGSGKAPAPTLFVIAHGLDVMRTEEVYTEVAVQLAREGWVCVILEPPCHGEDVVPGEPKYLEGWRSRVERDQEFIGAFTAKGRAVLDLLIAEKVADPDRVAVYGTSRGGFLAYHLAAAEPRIKAAAGVSPVTRLTALREFSGMKDPAKAEQWDVARLGSKLAGRAIWLSIGNNDLRVNCDDAIAFTRSVVRASARPDKPEAIIPVELLVGPAAGHTKIEKAHERLAEWLRKTVLLRPDETPGGR